jgi:hypothetical protein
LDKKAESTMLSPHEVDLQHRLNTQLIQILREEEIKWYQRAKTNKLLYDDSKTKYFHLVANGKNRKKRIFQFEEDCQIIRGGDQLKNYITEYYRGMFGHMEDDHLSLDERLILDILQVSQEENEFLTAPFTEKEVKEAIFQMKHNKAPGPDGFPVEFYQVFWETIKGDLMALFKDFHEGRFPLFIPNFGIITLLPKQKEATHIKHFCPICLLNISFKIFTKVVVNRISGIVEKLISPTQTAFIPGRNIMEGVVMLHETIHKIHIKRMSGVILKLDFEKAYHKVNWNFLQQTLRMKGFSVKWCHWISQFMTKGSVGIMVNEKLGRYFQTKKGLRQGDPLSALLFNLVADMLNLLISRAKEGGQSNGLVPHLIKGVISILQYVDDTILFMENDLEQATNMKLLLCAFERLSGLKINFHKSELFCYGDAKQMESQYTELFGCDLGQYPFRYLRILMNHKRITNADWKIIEEKFEKRLSYWKGKMLLYGGRLVLLNSVLSRLAMFMLSFFEVPKGVL